MKPKPCHYCKSDDTELLPCGYVRCNNCFAYGPVKKTPSEAVETWNKVSDAVFGGWVPVSERLPEPDVDTEYIVYCHKDDLCYAGVYMYSELTSENEWRFTNDCDAIYGVTHWRPLPQPPEA